MTEVICLKCGLPKDIKKDFYHRSGGKPISRYCIPCYIEENKLQYKKRRMKKFGLSEVELSDLKIGSTFFLKPSGNPYTITDTYTKNGESYVVSRSKARVVFLEMEKKVYV